MFDVLPVRTLVTILFAFFFFNGCFSLCWQRKFSIKTTLIRAAALAAAGSGGFCFTSSSDHSKDSSHDSMNFMFFVVDKFENLKPAFVVFEQLAMNEYFSSY